MLCAWAQRAPTTIRIYIHSYIHTHKNVCTYLCNKLSIYIIYICTDINIYAHIYMYVWYGMVWLVWYGMVWYGCMYVCNVCMYVCNVCMYACMHACMYICKYIFTYIHIYIYIFT